MKFRFSVIFVGMIALLIGFNTGYLLGQSPMAPFRAFPTAPHSEETGEAFEPFWEVYDLIQARYYEQPLNDELLAEGYTNVEAYLYGLASP